jgi:YYY domain-containing protein
LFVLGTITVVGLVATLPWEDQLHVVYWWLFFVLLSVVGLPLASVLFRDFTTRGVGFSGPLGLAIIGLSLFWIGQVAFTGTVIGLVLATYFGGNLLLERLEGSGREISLRTVVHLLVVFTTVYVVVAWFSSTMYGIRPVGGGEDFLHFGLFTSLVRTSTLPPEDFWFAGRSVHYYYGSHLVMAALTRVSGLSMYHSFSLLFAGLLGFAATGVYSIGWELSTRRDYIGPIGGLLSLGFVFCVGNLQTSVKLVLGWLPDRVATVITGDILRLPGGWQSWGPSQFDYHSAIRVIPNTINEFPLHSLLQGSQSPHVMSLPFFVLMLGLLACYYRTPQTNVRRRRLVMLAILPVVGGFNAVVNTWDFVTFGGVVWLTLLLAPTPANDLLPARIAAILDRVDVYDSKQYDDPLAERELEAILDATVVTGVVLAITYLLAVPFFLESVTSRSIEILRPHRRSRVVHLLLVHGLFLGPFYAYLGTRIRRFRPALVIGFVIAGLSVYAGVLAGVLFVPLIVGVWVLTRTDSTLGFETVLVLAGAGLVLLLELFEIGGVGRVNTIFKFYYHVWILWAIAAGPVVLDVVNWIRPLRIPSPSPSGVRWTVTVVLVAVVVLGPVYSVLAVGDRVDASDTQRVDNFDWVESEHPADARAIAHLSCLDGRPRVATAPGEDPYEWVSYVSSYTGLPTLAGWRHVHQYHDNPREYASRSEDVELLYEGGATRRVLERYEVSYVYVGPVERARYNVSVLDTKPFLESVYAGDGVEIFAVRFQDTQAFPETPC